MLQSKKESRKFKEFLLKSKFNLNQFTNYTTEYHASKILTYLDKLFVDYHCQTDDIYPWFSSVSSSVALLSSN